MRGTSADRDETSVAVGLYLIHTTHYSQSPENGNSPYLRARSRLLAEERYRSKTPKVFSKYSGLFERIAPPIERSMRKLAGCFMKKNSRDFVISRGGDRAGVLKGIVRSVDIHFEIGHRRVVQGDSGFSFLPK